MWDDFHLSDIVLLSGIVTAHIQRSFRHVRTHLYIPFAFTLFILLLLLLTPSHRIRNSIVYVGTALTHNNQNQIRSVSETQRQSVWLPPGAGMMNGAHMIVHFPIQSDRF